MQLLTAAVAAAAAAAAVPNPNPVPRMLVAAATSGETRSDSYWSPAYLEQRDPSALEKSGMVSRESRTHAFVGQLTERTKYYRGGGNPKIIGILFRAC